MYNDKINKEENQKIDKKSVDLYWLALPKILQKGGFLGEVAKGNPALLGDSFCLCVLPKKAFSISLSYLTYFARSQFLIIFQTFKLAREGVYAQVGLPS